MHKPKPKMPHTLPFTPRCKELLALEGVYEGGITLSCRHRDILRCSNTKHFGSCFKPRPPIKRWDGLGPDCYSINSIQPILYNYNPNICIIFKRDRSGQFEGRVFGRFVIQVEDITSKVNESKVARHELLLSRIYGNGLSFEGLRKIFDKYIILRETHTYLYLPVPW